MSESTPATRARVDVDLVSSFISDCRLRGMSLESIRGYRSNLGIYARYLDSRGISPLVVDREVLREFLHYLRVDRGVSQKRVENYFSSLSSFYEYLAYEGHVAGNPVLAVRKRYLRGYKQDVRPDERRLLSVEEMGMLVNSIMSTRDKAIVALLAKTGVRRGELVSMDVGDVDWAEQSITLKPRAKRSNRLVFFDDECAALLKRWLACREAMGPRGDALFLGDKGSRIQANRVYDLVAYWSARVGLNDSSSSGSGDHFSPHRLRHWFTTWLRRRGMRRELIQELRGDSRREAIDVYDHIDRGELRRSYLACIPKLGIA